MFIIVIFRFDETEWTKHAEIKIDQMASFNLSFIIEKERERYAYLVLRHSCNQGSAGDLWQVIRFDYIEDGYTPGVGFVFISNKCSEFKIPNL